MILEQTDKVGIAREDIAVDCLTLTVSAQQEQAAEELESLRKTPPPGARLKWQATAVEELPDEAGSRVFVYARS